MEMIRPRTLVRWFWMGVLLGLPVVSARAASRPPVQPASGPGGASYPHAGMTKKSYGAGDMQFWIFEPAAPVPQTAPVIIFLHGWVVMEPRMYEAWIKHIVRRGQIVIYPRYQSDWFTTLSTFTRSGITAVKMALRELETGNHVRPDRQRVAIVGHSMGGSMAANFAAVAAAEGLPIPKAIMPVQPGSYANLKFSPRMPLADFGQIPAETLMLVVVGDQDRLVGDRDAKLIFRQTPQIPATNKNYITLVTDRRGDPPLEANHNTPIAPLEMPWYAPHGNSFCRIDALDWYGTWKLFDALTDAAFYGTNREYALGNTPPQRFMGQWSDGVPANELNVTNEP
jgi:pimeloyl-ACP methyl ester carboxylesterase